jgi:hypothetical protein
VSLYSIQILKLPGMKKRIKVFFVVLLLLSINSFAQTRYKVSPHHDFKVVFKDGSSRVINGLINSISHKNLALLSKDTTIYPKETQYISIIKDGKEIIGMASPDSSCWLFTSIKGKISVYSAIPELKGRMDRIEKNGILVPYTVENFSNMLSDNPQLQNKYNRYVKRVKNQIVMRKNGTFLLVLLGAGLVGGAVGVILPPTSGFIFAGACLGAAVIIRKTAFTPFKAVEQYNK